MPSSRYNEMEKDRRREWHAHVNRMNDDRLARITKNVLGRIVDVRLPGRAVIAGNYTAES